MGCEKIDLGCGMEKRREFFGVDFNSNFNPDLVWDLNDIPYPFGDQSVNYIYTSQVYEHLTINSIELFQECYRVLKSDGTLEIHTPNMFSLKKRLLFLFGKFESNRDWNPYHTKMTHPVFIRRVLRQIGFDAKFHHKRCRSFPFDYLFTQNIWIIARKRT